MLTFALLSAVDSSHSSGGVLTFALVSSVYSSHISGEVPPPTHFHREREIFADVPGKI